ncbi:MAG: hypothetical protein WA063_03160 [Minisyncoccia bacterium]
MEIPEDENKIFSALIIDADRIEIEQNKKIMQIVEILQTNNTPVIISKAQDDFENSVYNVLFERSIPLDQTILVLDERHKNNAHFENKGFHSIKIVNGQEELAKYLWLKNYMGLFDGRSC